MLDFDRLEQKLSRANPVLRFGKITRVIGLIIESQGPDVSLGEVCYIQNKDGRKLTQAEVVGFKENRVLLMPFGEMTGINPNCRVIPTGKSLKIKVGPELLGQVLDGLGNPIMEDKLDLNLEYPVQSPPPNPLTRRRIDEPITLGIRAIDGLLTCGKGQRIGIFAGSGVGKSTLLGMIARNTNADVNVIGLIGERGREVREFLERDLGPQGLARSVVVVATSDQPALIRMKGALVTTAIAEYFRDQGKDVLLMMDSVTRIATALREVGLAVGEPPATRGYTPSVFATLPKLLERTGNNERGTCTALYTVLVEGDDFNEPVTDTVRGILDGHILLSRELAARHHYPAIDILGSVSRVMPNIVDKDHLAAAGRLKKLMAAYREAEDLINIGAYQKGSNPDVDEALRKLDRINQFLTQGLTEQSSFEETKSMLMDLVFS
ncbi:flagellar protein export ATPase FliI [Anoxybacter fermentans]